MQIALNTYSLRKEWKFFKKDKWAPVFRFCEMAGITQFEVLDRHFEDWNMKELKENIESHGMQIFSLGPHPHFLTNPPNFEKNITEGKKWVDTCAEIGVQYFRVALGGGKYDPPTQTPSSLQEAVDWAVKVFEPVITYAESRGVTPCVETHHRYSSNPEFQAKLLEQVPSKNLGFAYDIGNHENDEIRWASLDVLIKKKAVKYVHAKAYAFDSKGLETKLDYPRMVKELLAAGLDIPLSIEWEGHLLGPIGVLKTNELCKYSIAKAKNESYVIKTAFPDKKGLKKLLLS